MKPKIQFRLLEDKAPVTATYPAPTQSNEQKLSWTLIELGNLDELEDTQQVAINQLGETTNLASKQQTGKQKSERFEEEPY